QLRAWRRLHGRRLCRILHRVDARPRGSTIDNKPGYRAVGRDDRRRFGGNGYRALRLPAGTKVFPDDDADHGDRRFTTNRKPVCRTYRRSAARVSGLSWIAEPGAKPLVRQRSYLEGADHYFRRFDRTDGAVAVDRLQDKSRHCDESSFIQPELG